MLLIIVDFDGTLVDTTPIIIASVTGTFSRIGLKPPSFETYCKEFDSGRNFFKEHPVPIDEAERVRYFKECYTADAPSMQIFEGVYDALETFRSWNIPMCLVTGNRRELVKPLLEKFGIKDFFEISVYSASDKGSELEMLCRRFEVPSSRTCYVGDMPADVRHARRAGVVPVVFLNGHIPEDYFVDDALPDHKVRSFRELVEFVHHARLYGVEFAGTP